MLWKVNQIIYDYWWHWNFHYSRWCCHIRVLIASQPGCCFDKKDISFILIYESGSRVNLKRRFVCVRFQVIGGFWSCFVFCRFLSQRSRSWKIWGREPCFYTHRGDRGCLIRRNITWSHEILKGHPDPRKFVYNFQHVLNSFLADQLTRSFRFMQI